MMEVRPVYLILKILWLYLGNTCIYAANRTDAENILNFVFNDYNREVQPYYDKTLNVTLSFMLLSVLEFDEVAGILSTVSAIMLSWNDDRIRWNSSEYGQLDFMRIPISKLWYPELFCLTQADKLERIGDEKLWGRIEEDGNVGRVMGSLLKTSCTVDLTYFPYDEQVCKLQFSTWGYYSTEIYMKKGNIFYQFYRENPRWGIIRFEMIEEKLGNDANFIVIDIAIKRRPQHFVVTTLAPIVMLMLMNPFVFVLPVESGERMSYTVTIFLSQVVFMTLVGQNMPNSAHPMPRISYFLLVSMVISILQTLATIALMTLTFSTTKWNKSLWLIKIASVCRCIDMPTARNGSSVEDTMQNQENEIVDCSASCERSHGQIEHISSRKLAILLSKVAFVVSIFIVVGILITLIIAMSI